MLTGRSRSPAVLLSFVLVAMTTSVHADPRRLAKDPRHGAGVSPPTFAGPAPFAMPSPPPVRPRPAPAVEVVLDGASGGLGVPDALVAGANPAIAHALDRDLRVQVVPPGTPLTPGRPRFVLSAFVSQTERADGARVCVRIAVQISARVRQLRAGCASASGPVRGRARELALGGAVRGALRNFPDRPSP